MADNLALAGYRDFEIYRIGFISNGNLFIKRILNAGRDLPGCGYLLMLLSSWQNRNKE